MMLQVSTTDGASSENGEIILRDNGKEIARAKSDLTAEEAIRSLHVLTLFPDMEFSFAPKELIRARVTVSSVVDLYVRGRIMVGDTSGFWQATRTKSALFETEAPGRDYVNDRPGEGWELGFPRFVLDLDPVHRFRVAVMVEKLLYDLTDGKTETVGVSRQLSNTFTAADPVWLKLPLIKKAT